MILLKKPNEIALMRLAGHRLCNWMESIMKQLEDRSIKSGQEIADDFLRILTILDGAFPHSSWGAPFIKERNPNGIYYGHPICVSVNDEIVHSRPTKREFKEGDIVTIDAGLSYQGWIADMAMTTVFGGITTFGDERLIRGTNEALWRGIRVCKPGTRLREVSEAMASTAEEFGLSIIIDFVGHGIGQTLHEMPRIPNKSGICEESDDIILRPGMVFCLEPMFSDGSAKTVTDADGWRVWTQDGSLAVHFEHQVAITEEGFEVLTKAEEDNAISQTG